MSCCLHHSFWERSLRCQEPMLANICSRTDSFFAMKFSCKTIRPPHVRQEAVHRRGTLRVYVNFQPYERFRYRFARGQILCRIQKGFQAKKGLSANFVNLRKNEWFNGGLLVDNQPICSAFKIRSGSRRQKANAWIFRSRQTSRKLAICILHNF